ncbi:MAG: hypothetical protein HQK99_04540 [Nitrospirae bacterium]|nr:hypothetical protein [Nitrospirota bacterium]
MKKVLVLSVLAVFMLIGVSYGASITGVVENIDKSKGMFSVKELNIEVGFNCDGSLIKEINKGDSVKVDYSVEDSSAKAVSVVKLGNAGQREIIGKIHNINPSKGLLVIKDKEVEVGFDCTGTPLTKLKIGDTVSVHYTVENGREKVQDIKIKP